MKTPGINFKTKFILLLCIAVVVFLTLGAVLVRSYWLNSLVDTAGEKHREMAKMLAASVSGGIDYEAELVRLKTGGIVSIGDIAFDDKSGTWSLVFQSQQKSAAEGQAAGSGTFPVDITTLFNPLEAFRLGKSGGAALVDDKSYLIFHPGVRPYVNKYCSYDDLQKALRSRNRWVFLDTCYMCSGQTFVAYAEVPNPMLQKKGLKWYVIVEQDAWEVFAPVGNFTSRLAVAAIVIAIAAVFIGLLLITLFLEPVSALHDAMRRLGAGDLEYRVKAGNKDEIGELGAAFNDMAGELKTTTTSISALNKEAQARRRAEERAARVAGEFDLAMSQMQTLIKAGGGSEKLAKEASSAQELAKTESGMIELKLAVIDVKSLLKKTVFVYEPKIREKGFDFRVDIPRGEVYINVDSNKIIQAFNTLIESAMARAQKGRIEIAVKEVKDDVECSITYSGVEITGEDLVKTLELAIAKRIIENHSGKLNCAKDSFGAGKIIFTLPKHNK